MLERSGTEAQRALSAQLKRVRVWDGLCTFQDRPSLCCHLTMLCKLIDRPVPQRKAIKRDGEEVKLNSWKNRFFSFFVISEHKVQCCYLPSYQSPQTKHSPPCEIGKKAHQTHPASMALLFPAVSSSMQ